MTLKLITADEASESLSMADRLMLIMRKCIASNPNTVLVIWETEGETLEMRCEPPYPTVAVGLIELAKMQVRSYL